MRQLVLLDHADGVVEVSETGADERQLRVRMHDPRDFVPSSSWRTRYDLDLLRAVLAAKGPAWLVDEVRRDEDPGYVRQHFEHDLLAYLRPEDFEARRVLDFGCGCGASTVLLARMFPGAEVVGVELEAAFVDVAELRIRHHGLGNAVVRPSPAPDRLPDGLADFDYVVLSGVFEHLLPAERRVLLPRLWSVLRPGGLLLIGQTPHRWFPLESHTTGIPGLNYLPPGLALPLARRLSRKISPDADWPEALRQGIRGATEGEILALITGGGGRPSLLAPREHRDRVELWYALSSGFRASRAKRVTRLLLQVLRGATGITLVPYLSLAIRRDDVRSSPESSL